MERTVTAQYDSREAAADARDRLIGIGVAAGAIIIREPVQQPGMFDHLARMLAPAQAGSSESPGYHLSAEVPAERVSQAMLVLGDAATSTATANGPRDQIFEFPETREELRVEKRPFVTEEVVLRKEVTERVEDVHGTLRRTEVEVEEIASPTFSPPVEPRDKPAGVEPDAPQEPLRFGLRTRPE